MAVRSVTVMAGREARPLPTVTLNDEGKKVTDIHGFRAAHFDLDDYHPHPSIPSIPVSP